MNNTLKMTLFWVIAFVITIAAARYQRLTGPTHPKRILLEVENTQYKLGLVRSHGGETDCPLIYTIPDAGVSGSVTFRRYPTGDNWHTLEMVREGEVLKAKLPNQPPAGKVEYKVAFFKDGKALNNPEIDHVLVRFKGHVPLGVLIPHIFFIFLAMMLSNLAGILALAKHEKMAFYGSLTLVFLIIGGMIFGPIMQKFAFGEFWTGFPFGKDMTDNKTLFALLGWIAAVIANRKKLRPRWIIVAAIIMLLVYLIPHSIFGSEFNYESGTVITG